MPCRGAGSPASASTPPNAPRSSARWMAAGGVPTMGTPAASRRVRQTQRGLPAQLHDDAGDRAGGLLGCDDLEDVLEGERLEVEPVGGVVVGGDGLGVAVDHHRLEPRVGQREAGVHAGVVELHPLPDAVRPAAEDDDRGPVAGRHLGLLVVGGVVVGRAGRELRGAGVDGLVDGPDSEGVTQGADDVLVEPAQGAELGVGEAVPLGSAQQGRASVRARRVRRSRSRRAARSGRGTTGRCRSLSKVSSTDAPARRASSTSCSRPSWATEAALRHSRRLTGVAAQLSAEPFFSRERRAFCRASVKLRPMAMTSPTLFIVVVRVGSADGNFSNANRGTFTTT